MLQPAMENSKMAMKNRILVFALFGATFAAILYASSSHAEPANYITGDCHQGDCARYYLVETFPAQSSTDQYLVHVKAIGYCNPGVLDCAKGEWVVGDQGIEIYNVRCSEPGHIRVFGPVTSSMQTQPEAEPCDYGFRCDLEESLRAVSVVKRQVVAFATSYRKLHHRVRKWS
jgi:hypothetical protein